MYFSNKVHVNILAKAMSEANKYVATREAKVAETSIII